MRCVVVGLLFLLPKPVAEKKGKKDQSQSKKEMGVHQLSPVIYWWIRDSFTLAVQPQKAEIRPVARGATSQIFCSLVPCVLC